MLFSSRLGSDTSRRHFHDDLNEAKEKKRAHFVIFDANSINVITAALHAFLRIQAFCRCNIKARLCFFFFLVKQ